ncbi:retrovirus-related pol polyprotein from transposon TNT 1-94 [Tanacetum coccineum]|uniref:Retrovirus-related pol polyprotein from transposon TNT 1-94 n=1 Tax=Tanacetum coccineum TaxID=301880 RepID=A0ABQ4XZ56_9ASTR
MAITVSYAYIDTRPNGDALRKCILKGPYTLTIVTTPAVPATEDSPAVPKQTTVEKVMNMTLENIAHFESEKEAIHLILTGIGDEIYSSVDACQTAQEMWEAIERLQQGESLNIQDIKTNLFWEFGQFTSHDGETIESYYTRFYKMMNEMIRNNLTQQHKLDEVSYHKLFDILKQYQMEVNELRAERMAKNTNPLALVATAQTLQDPYYQTSKPHKSYAPTSKASLPTRSHATTRYKGKEIAKPITPPSESASEEDSDPEQAQKDKDMQKNLALIAKYFKKLYKPTNNNLRTSSNTRNKNVDTTPRYKNDNQTGQFGNQRAVNVVGARETVGGPVVQQSGIQCFNCKEFGHYAKECRKPKRVKDSTYHKEKMLLCKQAEKGVQLQAEQSDWLADTDEEIDEQELEAHYSYMAKIQEVPNADSGTDAEPLEQVHYDTDHNVFANDLQHFEQSESIRNTCAVETGDSNVIPDSPDMCDNDIQNDQHDVECDDERVALANLIANLKLDVDDNKKIQKQLKKANATLTQELTECKSILAETSRTLGESNSIRDSCLVALQNKQTEFERYKAFNDRTVDYDNLKFKVVEFLKMNDELESDKDLVQGNIRSNRVYYVKVSFTIFLGCQLFDADVEVAFLKSSILLRDIQGNDLLTVYLDTLSTLKDEKTSSFKQDFLTMIQRNLQAPVISVRTDRGTEFLNKTLNAFFKEEGIEHQTSTPRTPEQNGVVERRNRTLVEAARTMLSASKLPLFFWAKAIATACYTQNRSIIIPTHEK